MGTASISSFLLAALLQVPQAEISGHIRGGSDEPIEGAVVLLSDLGRGVLSAADGSYRISDVPPGVQHLTVSYLGHAGRIVHALVPGSGSLRIDVTLAPSPIPLPGIVVIPSRQPTRSVVGHPARAFDRALTLAQIRAHPMLAQPDPFEALAGGSVVVDPEAPTAIHVRGGGSDHTAYVLNGIPILEPVHAAGLFSAWNSDALSEISLSSTQVPLEFPDALSGVVSGRVREAGGQFSSETTLSTTHASVSARGPLPSAGGGYVLSLRSGYPGVFAPGSEGTYLRGETGDILAAANTRVLGSDADLLFYDSDNDLSVPSTLSGAASPHSFEWHSRSVGGSWRLTGDGRDVLFSAWHAGVSTASDWLHAEGGRSLESRRKDVGMQVLVRAADAPGWDLGLRASRLSSHYDGGAQIRSAALPVVSLLTELRSAFGPVEVSVASSLASTFPGVYWSPRGAIAWRISAEWSWSLAVSRMHQFTQSLRNAESVVGRIYGADPSVVAGVGGVPVPLSDQVVSSLVWHPSPRLKIDVEAYVRRTSGLALVAPVEPAPFSSGPFVVGRGTSRGASADLSGEESRYAWLVSYALESTHLMTDDLTYTPGHSAAHRIDAGLTLNPSATTTLRLGLRTLLGRRATDVGGAFEWEACNLLDRGCEFAGAPTSDGTPGGRRLPAYLRADLGARKHWHIRLGGRESTLALFGTVTNVLGRRNALVFANDPVSGETSAVNMRPPSPLVLGVDLRF